MAEHWSFVKRDRNQIAHKLANWALSTTTSMMYELNIHSVASDLVAQVAA